MARLTWMGDEKRTGQSMGPTTICPPNTRNTRNRRWERQQFCPSGIRVFRVFGGQPLLSIRVTRGSPPPVEWLGERN